MYIKSGEGNSSGGNVKSERKVNFLNIFKDIASITIPIFVLKSFKIFSNTFPFVLKTRIPASRTRLSE